jgi:hypothetical protein
VQEYDGRVGLSGSTAAHATIQDIEAASWTAHVRDIAGFDFQPGLVTLELLDGSSAGLFAIGDLQYPAGAQVFPYREGPAVVFGKTPFGPKPTPT